MKTNLLTVTLVSLLAVPAAALAVDLETCFQIVPPEEVGVVQADLDCSGLEDVVSFVLEDGARLELNGHALLGNATSGGIVCRGQCTIAGPGTLSGYGYAIYGEGGAVEVSDLSLLDNAGSIDVVGPLTATRVDAASTRFGIRASRVLRLSDVEVTNSGGNGVLARRISGEDVTITGCHTAVNANGSVRLTRLTATGNVTAGVVARSVRLTDSLLAGNGVDILSQTEPSLAGTSCQSSARRIKVRGGFTTGGTWGVCAGS